MTHDESISRIGHRSDIVQKLTHLTRATETLSSFQVLCKILEDQKLMGSTTESGYICGSTPAVCFQEVPIYSIAENLLYENQLVLDNPSYSPRYGGSGICVNRETIFRAGGRPVIYGKTQELKAILPQDQYWRIVNLDLDNDKHIIDWTHEREWRFPGDFHFTYDQIHVIVAGIQERKQLIEYFESRNRTDVLKSIKSIICISQLLG